MAYLPSNRQIVLNAAAANGAATNPVDISSFDIITITVIGSAAVNLTLKNAISDQETAPNLASAASATNEYDYGIVKNLNSKDEIAGDTGLTAGNGITAGGVDIYNLEVEGVKWYIPIVSNYVAGNVTVIVRGWSKN